ncbi:MAG: 16S rRNA (guanine(527)-N(7))-methyltransferase RsmG [Nitrospirae bacterium]|nr:16S rRNA (guanine(527)-N(7))-methyltransferase RsmG [Nitrospirota bacterium]
MERGGRFSEFLVLGAAELGLSLNDRIISELTVYFRELTIWNKKINLTAIKQEKEVAVKHFLDSMACSKALLSTQSASLLDIGTGAGFPGLPLKILHPELDLTLLEPSHKKTAFLRHLIGTLQLSKAVVLSTRIEDFSNDLDQAGRFAHIITRALDIKQILPFVRSLLRDQGRLILCRAKPLEKQLDLDGLKLTGEITYALPYGYGNRVLAVLEPVSAG